MSEMQVFDYAKIFTATADFIGKRPFHKIGLSNQSSSMSHTSTRTRAIVFKWPNDTLGYNNYGWCDPSSFTVSGYKQFVDRYKNVSVPQFFSEYGCTQNSGSKRTFDEVQAIYSDQMTPELSGVSLCFTGAL